MICRRGVAKYVKGIGLKFKPEEKDLIGVFDMHKQAYRFINIKTLEQIKIKGIKYNIKQDKE